MLYESLAHYANGMVGALGFTCNWFVRVLAPGWSDKVEDIALLALLIVEVTYSKLLARQWSGEEIPGNVSSTIVGMLIDVIAGGVFVGAYLFFYRFRLVTLQNNLLAMGYSLVVFEVVLYVQHWAYHRIAIFWALHSVHHSATSMNITVATRSFWGLSALVPIEYTLLPLAGVPLHSLATFGLTYALWGYLQHVSVFPRVRWLDAVVNTPACHRLHHGTQQRYIDRNFSQGFLQLDRLFGTYVAEVEQPLYGLVGQTVGKNPLRFQFHGIVALIRKVRRARSGWEGINYLLREPGWGTDPVSRGAVSRADTNRKSALTESRLPGERQGG